MTAPPVVTSAPPQAAPQTHAERSAEDQERERILLALRETNGIVAGPNGAAARLGWTRGTLLSRIQQLGISLYSANARQTERELILNALRETNGVVAGEKGAAAKLGIRRSTLLSRMQRLGISPQEVKVAKRLLSFAHAGEDLSEQ